MRFIGLNSIASTSLLMWVACSAGSLGPAQRPPLAFERDTQAAEAPEPAVNVPVAPELAIELLRSGTAENRSEAGAGGGTTGAERHTIYFPEIDLEFDVKWKPVPGLRLDGINNSPRKELASYAIQRLFLEPRDYVVPPTTMHCVPLTRYRRTHPMATPTLVEIDCVLGVVSVWLTNVTIPDGDLYSEERFLHEPEYARYLADLNLFTYLVDHRDGRTGNFLISKDERHRRVFAVDNGITFGPWVYNYFVENWTHLRVPAVRKTSIERLRTTTRADLDFLAVVEQFEIDDAKQLRPVAPGAPDDPDAGATWRKGRAQFGLTRSEIDGVYERIQALLAGVDSGHVPVF